MCQTRSETQRTGFLTSQLMCVISFFSTVEEQGGNPCLGIKSCGKCIAKSPKCGWCGDLDYDKANQDRCDLLETLKNLGCSAVNISNPDNKLEYIDVS